MRVDPVRGVFIKINLPLLLSPAVFWFLFAEWYTASVRRRFPLSVHLCVCVFPVYHVNGSRGFVVGYKQVVYRVFSNRCRN